MLRYSIIVLGLVSNAVFAEGFRDAIPGPTEMPDELLDAMWHDAEGPFIPDAVVEEETGVYIWLFRAVSLGRYDLNLKKSLGGWSLSRWPHLQRPVEVLYDHNSEGKTPWKEKVEYTFHQPYPGCMNQHPLRYGDIDSDASNEVVLTVNGELIVFSLDHQRTVFSAFYDASDWFKQLPEGAEFAQDVEEGESSQYFSEFLMDNGIKYRGHRSYTKVYLGDFDVDENRDIISRQKVYVSNKVGEGEGFRLVRDQVKFFEQDLKAQAESPQGVTGEYLPQDTDPSVVQEWLAKNELTWSKGWPSTSECEGQEGKLIPEMHDPLLNDPDVLK